MESASHWRLKQRHLAVPRPVRADLSRRLERRERVVQPDHRSDAGLGQFSREGERHALRQARHHRRAGARRFGRSVEARPQ